VNALDLISQQDFKQILGWNSTQPEIINACLHEIFDSQVTMRPEAPAVCSYDVNFTYKELDVHSTRLARYLTSLGVGPEVMVPVCFDKSAWTIVAMLGILKAGGACVALDPKHPVSRLKDIAHDIEAQLVMVAPCYASVFEEFISHVIAVDAATIVNLPAEKMTMAKTKPADAAFVVFTSGSTGQPKGIVLEHASLCTSAHAHGTVTGIGPQSRVLQFAAYTFDVSIQDIFTTLMRGGCVCIITDNERLDDLAGAINRLNANWACLTSTVARLIHPNEVPSIKTLVLGGEPASVDVVMKWADHVELSNVYGPAESSIWTSCNPKLRADSNPSNIGRALASRLWIADINDHSRLVPIGCIGELLLEGPLLARGYLKNKEKTEAAFIQAPDWPGSNHGSRGTRRMYKTGDLVRYNLDGTLSYVGRKDTQVKLRGQRIELGEIEHYINVQFPDLVQVAVDVISTGTSLNQKMLAAFLQFKGIHGGGAQGDVVLPISDTQRSQLMDLQISLSNSLPLYMIPSVYIPVRVMPTTTSGKLDRITLRGLAGGISDTSMLRYSLSNVAKRAPSTVSETALQGIWAQVLGVEQTSIGADDNFFRLGGDSVGAMRMVSIAQNKAVHLTVAKIFRYPELSKMAQELEALKASEIAEAKLEPFCLLQDRDSLAEILQQASAQCQVKPEDIEDIYPCTPLQEGLVAISVRQAGAYVSQMAFRMPRRVTLERFKEAWEKVIEAHPILRTRVINPTVGASLQVVIRKNIVWQAGTSLKAYLEADRKIPITRGGPLLRLGISGSSEGDRHFIWTAHHAVYDGYSIGLILDQVSKCFEENIMPEPSSFSRFISYVKDSENEASGNFWRKQFDGDQSVTFPQVTTDHQPRSYQLQRYSMALPHRHNSGITTSTVIRAAWAILVARYSDADDVVFGATLSGRNASINSINKIVGPTIATVPIRVQLNCAKAIGEFLNAVQDQATEMIPFEHAGLQSIRSLLGNASKAVDPMNLLVVQPAEEAQKSTSFLGLDAVPVELEDFPSYPLVMVCTVGVGMVSIEATFDKSILPPEQVRRMLEQFEHVVRQLSEKPETMPLDSVDLFSAHDRSQVLEWNSRQPEAVDACVHSIFESQVSATPNALAICSFDGNFTYQELDVLSNRLAHYLISLGICPETIVPLCFDKSAWTVVAMLGVMKAGGAFFSLSPTHPLPRSLDMIIEVEARIMLVAPQYRDLFARHIPQVVSIDSSFLETIPKTESLPLPCKVGPGNMAILIHTSGTTGKPKAVVLEHGALSSSIKYHGQAMGIDSSSRVFQFSSYTFDASIFDIFTTICRGGCTCIPSEAQRMGDLAFIMRQLEVNVSFLTPTVARTICPDTVPSLKTLIMGGEAISDTDISVWVDRVNLILGYGPSECCIACSCESFNSSRRSRYIGRAIGCFSWIVEPANFNKLTPIGLVGELLIQGPNLARGYLNNSKKTAQAFIEMPSWMPSSHSAKYQRLYRTGDLVRYNSDGTMDYVGRMDTQVKIRGQRVELNEIEYHVKASLPSVQQLAVEIVVRPNSAERETLALFLCPPGHDLAEKSEPGDILLPLSDAIQQQLNTLQTSLTNKFPMYMVPSMYITLKAMPTMTSGKLDRGLLRQLVCSLSEAQLLRYSLADIAKRAPSTVTEKELQILWSDILGIPEASIGADDNFFRLGGDSVVAMRLIVAAEASGWTLRITDIFRYPQLSEMSKVLEKGSITTKDVEAFSLLRGKGRIGDVLREAATQCCVGVDHIEDLYPCTPLQEGLLAISVRQRGAYLSQMVFRIPSTVPMDRFKEAWETVIGVQPILRTRIVNSKSAGSIQVVVRDNVTWGSGSCLDGYLKADMEVPITHGGPLHRLAIIEESSTENRHFIWTAHHAIYDGLSMGLIFDQVTKVFEQSIVPTSSLFNRFIEHLEKIDIEASQNFWRAQFDGNQPTSFPQNVIAGHQLRPDLTHRHSMKLPNKQGTLVTNSILLRAAWAVILARYSNSDDVVFGATLSGRNTAIEGIAQIVGPTITTVPIRVRLDRDRTVSEFLKAMQDQAIEMTPFEHTGLQNIRHLIGNADAAVDLRNLFFVQPAEEAVKASGFLGLEPVSPGLDHFQTYALVISCTIDKSQVHIEATFDESVIQVQQMRRMLEQFEHVVSQLSEKLDMALASVDLFSVQDRNQILEWNISQPEAVNSCVHEIFERWVTRTPTAPAVSSFDGNFTYQELDALSTRLAHYLSNLGVGPESMIPLCFDKSAWTIVAMMGVLKAGGAYFSINPTHPVARSLGMVKDAQANLVLCSPQHAGLFVDWVTKVVSIDSWFLETLPESHALASSLARIVRPDNAAILIFTSGSTGKPKAVVLEHRTISSSMEYHGRAMGISPSSRVLQYSSYTFDASIFDIFTTLCRGGCVCVPSEAQRMDDLTAAIRLLNVNVSFLTPTVARTIRQDSVPSIKTLILGGEPINETDISSWVNNVTLISGYGPSECCICCACDSFRGDNRRAGYIGRAIGSRSWIVEPDNHNRLTPVGLIGELLIQGPILARGYLNENQRTAENFIKNPDWLPFSQSDEDRRLYKTGDLVRYNADGTMDYVGRKDNQVKIRGQRVELSEIEHLAKASIPKIQFLAAEVVVRPGRTNMETLALFLCNSEDNSKMDEAGDIAIPLSDTFQTELVSLQQSLGDSLPRHMVPSIYITLQAMPKTSSGKLDRGLLRQLVLNLSEAQMRRYSLADVVKRVPSSVAEEQLQLFWADILGIKASSIGADDSFFRLGGDSIVAMRLAAIVQEHGWNLTVADIFRRPQLSDMAKALEESRTGDLGIKPVEPFSLVKNMGSLEDILHDAARQCHVYIEQIEDIYPCTPLQESLMDISARQANAYVSQMAFRMPATLAIDRFKEVWEKLVEVHPILRTRIIHSGASLSSLQVVIQEGIEWKDGKSLETYLEVDRRLPIVHGGLLIRLGIAGSSEDDRYFVFSAHHAVYDGYSLGLLFEQAEKLLEHGPLPVGPSFNTFIKYLVEKSSDSTASDTFWQAQFAGETPSAYPALPSASYQPCPRHREHLSVKLPRYTNSSILPSTILRAAWALLMARYGDSDDVLFGTTLSGRNAPISGISRMVGPTITTVPLRVHLDREQSVMEYFQAIQSQSGDMIPFEHTGLQNIHRLGGNAQDAVFFRNLLIFQPSNESGPKAGSLGLKAVPTELEDFATYALILECGLEKDAVTIEARHDASIISSEQMRIMLWQLEHLIEQLSEGPETMKVAEIEMFGTKDQARVLKWNKSPPEVINSCVHSVVEQLCLKQPDKPAICGWDGELTYGELNHLSNRLAKYLQTLNVGPEVIVALCFDKSLWAIVAMLGVLKAGGAYTHLSPSHPAHRHKLILEDTKAHLVLVSPQYAKRFEDYKVLSVSSQEIDALPTAAGPVWSNVKPCNMAFVTYTSGSTGIPKGVVLEHSSIATSSQAHGRALGVGPDTRVLQFAAYTFDVHIQDIFTTLQRGGCICVISEHQRINDLAGSINALKVNFIPLTPTVARLLSPGAVPNVRTLSLGGEPATPDIIETWSPYVAIHDSYGPAECSINSASGTLKCGRDVGNIGRAVGTTLWIVEPNHDKLTPVGCIGELLVGGPQLARGYLNDSKKTEASFIRDPKWASRYNLGSGYRLYKTGDLVRYNSDGTLHFFGRRDAQVKLHGHRIELGEIEHQIYSQLTSKQSTAVVVGTVGGSIKRQMLVAFLQLEEGKGSMEQSESLLLPISEADYAYLRDLQASLAKLMPSYMVPSLYIPLNHLPKNLSGKLDRLKLKQVVTDLSEAQLIHYSLAGSKKRAPATEMEQNLRTLWAEVLGISMESIGADDSFLRLGGDSVTAMRLVAASQTKGWTLTVGDVFRHPQLSHLARSMEQSGYYDTTEQVIEPFSLLGNVDSLEDLLQDAASQCGLEIGQIEDMYPCTPLQEGLMAVTIRNQGTYLSQMVFKIPATLAVDRFQEVWQRVIESHPILRTRIVNLAAKGSLQVVARTNIAWQYHDSLDEYLKADKKAPITHGGPLIRLGITTSSTDDLHFIWTAHHSAYDGYSIGLIFDQVSKSFEQNLTPEPSFFNRFIGFLAQASIEDSNNFWRSQFDGNQPTPFPQQAVGGRQCQPDQRQWRSIAIPRREASGITKSTMLRAAWAIVMAKYSDSEDIVFGATVSGRNAALGGIAQMVGPTITTVPVRVRLHHGQSIGRLLQTIQDQATEMIPFEHTGLQNIRQLGGNAVVAGDLQNLLVIQPAEESGQRNDFLGLQTVPIELDNFQIYPLVIECTIKEDSVWINAHYDGLILPTLQVQRMLEQLEHVVQQLSEQPETLPLEKVEVFSSYDLQQVLAWNKSEPETVDACVHQVFGEQVNSTPDALAVHSFDGNFTFKELDIVSTRLAHYLSSLGVGPEVIVPLCFDKSAWTIVAMLGVLKAGGAYFSLNPSHPLARSLAMIKDTQAKILVAAPQHEELFAGHGLKVVAISPAFLTSLPGNGVGYPVQSVGANNAAILIFTSGSTGKPKAVVLEHRAVSTSISHHGKAMGIGPSSRVLQFSSYTFDASIFDIFTTLCRGGCVCVPSEAQRMGNFATVVQELEVNTSFLTPTVARTIHPDAVPTIKTLILGGEPISEGDINTWADRLNLISGYGPSECCICCSCDSFNSGNRRSRYIGRAIGSRSWIVEPTNHERLTPVGLVGELLVQGPVLARGYLNEPKRTAEAFVESPVWLPSGRIPNDQRLYKTGDLVRYNVDGTMDYVGRKDTQVKIRGQRVELNEIEHHVKTYLPDMLHLAAEVVIRPGSISSKEDLALFVCPPTKDTASDIKGSGDIVLPLSDSFQQRLNILQKSLADILPIYMIPSIFLTLRAMPTTSSGKLDRAVLRQMVSDLSDAQLQRFSLADVVKRPPSTRTEEELQGFWEDVLNIPKNSIGVDDSFLRLGGDSIVAMRLAAALQAHGWTISVADIFHHPRLHDMARVLEESKRHSGVIEEIEPFHLVQNLGSLVDLLKEASMQCGLEAEAIKDIYPCTPLQEGLMAVSVRQHGAYLSQMVFRMPADLDTNRFREAWEKVIDAHPILRTRIINSASGRALQVVVQEAVQWQSGVALDKYLEADMKIPIMHGGLLNRLAIIGESGMSCYFVWTIHHSIYDGFSISLVFDQVSRFFEQGVRPEPSYFNRFIGYLAEGDTEASNSFWQSQFEGGQPTSFPQPAVANRLPRPDCSQHYFIPLPSRHGSGITTPTILRAAWAMLIGRYSDSDDVIFGATLSGRNAAVTGIVRMLGPTITTVPVRVRLGGKQCIKDYLQAVQDQSIEMIPFEHTGLQNIRQLSSNARDAADLKNLLLIQPAEESGNEAAFLGLEPVPVELENFQSYALVIECNLRQETVDIEAQFDDAIIPALQVKRMLEQFEHIVKQLSELKDTTVIDSIDFISLSDRKQIFEWNNTDLKSINACVHEVFQRQAIARPNAPAICSYDGNFSYEQLDAFTNQLAYYLHTLGVGTEVMVPLCFGKSAWTIIAMLGVLKAGGVCVALNPQHPKRRLEGIIRDTEAHVVIVAPNYISLFEDMVHHVIAVDTAIFENFPTQVQSLPVTKPTNSAFVVFTSGSTGQPKGIVLEHSSLCTSAQAHGTATGIGPHSRVLQFAAYTFDVSIQDIFTTLMRGGCVCVISDEERLSDLANAIGRVNANWACLTSTVARLLEPSQVPTIKTLVLGGEPASADVVMKWADHVELSNVYGPAESSIWTSCNPRLTAQSDPTNIGRALASRLWIVESNDHNRLAPIGCIGELLLEGPLLARGYLNNKDKTEAAFIQAPGWLKNKIFEGHGRMYKTGDLVRYNMDGTICYVSRKDTQIKLRGQRLELGEIEYHIGAQLSEVGQVAVDVVSSGSSLNPQQTLAAFLKFKTYIATDSSESAVLPMSDSQQSRLLELQLSLGQSLPAYMIPSLFIPLRNMPSTTSGKLDRKALRQLAARLSPAQILCFSLADVAKQETVTRMEKILQALWAEVLGTEQGSIGANDSFFRLGGDSIGAMRMATMAQMQNLPLSVAHIFQYPQLSKLAKALESIEVIGDELTELRPFGLLESGDSLKRIIHEASAQCRIDQEQIEDIYPCTPLQEGLMSLSVRQQGAYVSQMVFRVPPTLSLDRFKQAWERVVEAHGILRTRIVNTTSGGSLQIVVREKIPWLSKNSLDEYLEEDRDTRITHGGRLNRLALTGDSENRHFIWTAHHAIYDGYSIGLLFDQVSRYFEQNIEPEPSYFNRFINYLTQSDIEESNSFWRNQFDGGQPASFPKQPVGGERQPRCDRVQRHSMILPHRHASRFTMSTILRAAWAMVLARYSDSDDVVFGATLSGRTAAIKGIMKMLGPTITTVPLRIRLNHLTIGDFLEAVQSQATDMIPFEHTGLQNIRHSSANARDAVDIQNLFVVQPAEQAEGSVGLLGLEAVPVELENFRTYALVMACNLEPSRISVEARFDENTLPAKQVQRMLYQFEHVVKQLIEESETTSLSSVELFGPHDQKQILEWNSQRPEAVNGCIHDIFKKQAMTTPDAPAICSSDVSFTYRELDALSTRMAHYLTSTILGPIAMVPLCFDKSAWSIIAMLGVMKAGGAYVSLNPSQPLPRLLDMIGDVEASIILVAPQYADLFLHHVPQVVTVDSCFLEILSKDSKISTYQLAKVSPDCPALVVFTSGSTGKPKAVVLEHKSVCTMTQVQSKNMRLSASSRVLQFAAYTFDVSNGEIHSTLMTGGCVCVPSEDERLSDLAGVIGRLNANWAFLTPTVASLLSPESVPGLKTLVLGGEASTKALVQRWANKVYLVMCYGPAECGIHCMSNPPANADTDPARIGKPIGALGWICNVSDHDRLAPIGCVGELLIEGPIVARGYFGDQKKTDEAFIRNPSWLSQNSRVQYRIYKTGDLVKYNPDGTISFVGRKDTQIKLHGQRIELSEIEHHVKSRLPSVEYLAVDVVERSTGAPKQSLALFVCPIATDAKEDILLPLSHSLQSTMADLQKSLGESLPTYMIPSLYIPLRSMPTTTSGKIDRASIRRIAARLSDEQMLRYSLADVVKRAPSTQVEQIMQALWANVLCISPQSIGADDSFFAVGGDSITAMKLVVLARSSHITLTVANIFAFPRLADMSTAVANGKSSFSDCSPRYQPFSLINVPDIEQFISEIISSSPTLSRDNITDILPSTNFQDLAITGTLMRSRWMLNYFCFSGTGPLAIEKLKQACFTVVQNHAILRTAFALHNGRYFQVVLGEANPGFRFYETEQDLHHCSMALQEKDKMHSLQLNESLIQFMVIKRRGTMDHQIIIRMSHAQYDGVSLPLILQDLAAAYNSQPAVASHAFSLYISDMLAQKTASFGHWRNLLAGSSMTSITSQQKPRYNRPSAKITHVVRTIPQFSLTSKGLTSATIIKAAWAYILAQLSAQSDVVFGHVVAGRNTETLQSENISGPCMNIQPVRVTMTRGWKAIDLLYVLQDQYAGNIPFESLGFREIVQHCTDWPNWTRFTSVVQHQNIAEKNPFILGDTKFDLSVSVAQEETADLTIFSLPKEHEIEISLSTANDEITPAFAEEILVMLCSTITNWTNNPDIPLYSPEILSGMSRQIPRPAAQSFTNGVIQIPSRPLEAKAIKLRNILLKAWTELLGEDVEIKLESSFWDLGGDLIGAGQLALLLQRNGVHVGIEDLIDHSTLKDQLYLLSLE